ncbi:MAG: YcbK family protein [Motiliproteus sp.]
MDRKGFNRRGFLKLAGGAVASGVAMPSWARTQPGRQQEQERALKLLNLHTGEHLEAPYWLEGEYLDEGLVQINRVLRDHRNGEIFEMDLQLLELLHEVQQQLGAKQPFHVISGYRSPATNQMLRQHSAGVAKKSLHMEGKAIDIRLPGVALRDLKVGALELGRGGVGYYPGSEFVHLDVGRTRFWKG